jgi:phosphoglycerate kinase
MNNPRKPLMAVIGGAKIADKIDILHRFIEIADYMAIGGAMANTFLASQGYDVGKSLYDKKELSVAHDIIRKAGLQAKKRPFVFILPFDVVVSDAIDNKLPTRVVDLKTQSFSAIKNYPRRPPLKDVKVLNNDIILDIGPFSGAFIAGAMQSCQTIIWNGTMGVTEVSSLIGSVGPFSHGTELVIEAMTGEFFTTPFSVVGGGDTVGYLAERHLINHFDHVSTGGGASLELMGGRKLPGVEALLNREN